MVKAVGSVVPGVLFEIQHDGLATLDEKEGINKGAYKRNDDCLVITDDGRELTAITYEVVDKENEHIPPSDEYCNIVGNGYRTHGLDINFLETAKNNKQRSLPVFVYGTLKRGHSRHGTLSKMATFACTGRIHGSLLDLGSYPGIFLDKGKGLVNGELYHVENSADCLAVLDDIEGVSHAVGSGLFRRVPIEVEGIRRKILAWAYVVNAQQGMSHIDSGEWQSRKYSNLEIASNWIKELRQEVSERRYRDVICRSACNIDPA